MWRSTLLLICFSGCCWAGPLGGMKRNVPIVLREEEPMVAASEVEADRPAPEPLAPELSMPATLTLPSNATSIRTDITDNFSCDDKVYGYYADVENDCQIFHVCLPVTYADGKENTFRWSFICPEETIFSQDSFTCMRREDMSITCEDSVNYYELNRNFGMTDEQSNNNAAVSTIEQQEVEMPSPEMEQPAEQQTASSESAPTPAIFANQQTKPMKPMKEKEQKKPMKVQKPNRRKPQPQMHTQSINPTNKLPPIAPLRKIPQAGPSTSDSNPIVMSNPPAEETYRPVPQRFKKRPTATSPVDKDSALPTEIKGVGTLSSDTNKRRRPVNTHKQNAVVNTNVAEEVPITEMQEPIVPSVKLESTLTSGQTPIEMVNPSNTAGTEREMIANAQSMQKFEPAADVEPQASETAEVSLEPENVLKVTDAQTNTLKIPETTSEIEKDKTVFNSPVPSDLSAAASTEEETKPDNVPKPEAQPSPVETIEANPAIISESEIESSPSESFTSVEEEKLEQPAEENKPAVVEAETAPQTTFDLAPVHISTSDISAEALTPSLEELEEQKPADAVESLPATPEMEQPNPLVEQMLEDKDAHMQSVGGFKPVDPALAAEAEALITDFLNTLKSDATHQQPVIPLQMAEEVPMKLMEDEDVNIKTEPITKVEEQPQFEETAEKAEDTQASDVRKEETSEAAQHASDEQPQMLENGMPLFKFPMSNSFPADMYQIPVQVIQTPNETPNTVSKSESESVDELKALETKVEEKKEDVTKVETMQLNEPKPDELRTNVETEPENVEVAQIVDPVVEKMSYRPISIDDIVELVKERLDQAPAAEKGTPMELVMEPTNPEKPLEVKFNVEKRPTEQETETSAEPQPAEDIIFPIYHRVSESNIHLVDNQNLAPETPIAMEKENENPTSSVKLTEDKTTESEDPAEQTVDQAVQVEELDTDKAKTETDEIGSTKTGTSRAYRSRSLNKAKMNPRKRQFLFRADAS